MLFDFDKINSTVLSHMPLKWKDNYAELTTRINTSLRNYVQGVFLVMFLVFITQSIGLTLAGLEAPLLFAVFCAVTDIIPYFGPFIGAVPGVILLIIVDIKFAIIFGILIFILQQFDGLYLGPKILGESTGLRPIWIIFAITVGGWVAGVVGMFLGVPVVAVISYLIDRSIKWRLKKRDIVFEEDKETEIISRQGMIVDETEYQVEVVDEEGE